MPAIMHKTIFSGLIGFMVFTAAAQAAGENILHLRAGADEFSRQTAILYLDAAEDVNALEATLHFDPAEITIQDVDDGGSVVPFWIEAPFYSNDAGFIRLAGAVPGGYSGAGGKIATISFTATRTGQLKGFTASIVKLYKNDGQGTLTHLEFRPAELEGSVTAPPDAIRFYYQDDVVPPEDFRPEVFRLPEVNENRWSVAFDTTDKGSGVDFFEILEVPIGDNSSKLGRKWQTATSPYPLQDQTLGSDIYIRAIDRAGNFRVVRIDSVHPPGAKTYSVTAVTLFAVLLLIGLAAFAWTKLRRRKGRQKNTSV